MCGVPKMIKIFYGDDRVKARAMADKLLGDSYEVIEAESLTRADMDSVFLGASLFGETRNILIKSLAENKECWAMLPKYADTTHTIILLENSVDKRSATYKELAKIKSVEFKEFRLAEPIDKSLVFDTVKIFKFQYLQYMFHIPPSVYSTKISFRDGSKTRTSSIS